MQYLRWALCALLLYAAGAPAADQDNQFAMKGAGLVPCSFYVSEREKRSNIYYMIGGWIEGYLSAHNRYTDATYDILSFESLEMLLLIIDNHCKANPDDRLYPVLSAMVAKLHPNRVTQESPRLEISEGERKTVLYRETIERMQRKLTELGLYKDTIDGRFTDATKAALIAFQSDIGFETTGFPDQSTLWRLLRQ